MPHKDAWRDTQQGRRTLLVVGTIALCASILALLWAIDAGDARVDEMRMDEERIPAALTRLEPESRNASTGTGRNTVADANSEQPGKDGPDELDAPDETHAFVSGRVVDERGAALLGARVLLTSQSKEMSCTTDSDGGFRLKLHWVFGHVKFPSLVAVCRGFAPSSMTFGHDQLSRHPSEIHCNDIVLKAGKALLGRVLGRGQAALAAVVRLVPARGQVPPPVWADGGGRFFRTVEPGASYELRITHPVLGFAQQYLKCKRDLEPVDLGFAAREKWTTSALENRTTRGSMESRVVALARLG